MWCSCWWCGCWWCGCWWCGRCCGVVVVVLVGVLLVVGGVAQVLMVPCGCWEVLSM